MTWHKHGRSKCRRRRFDSLGAATLGRDAVGGFDDHQISDKELDSVSVEINGGALRITLRDDTTTVLKMFDVLPDFRNRQESSSFETKNCADSYGRNAASNCCVHRVQSVRQNILFRRRIGFPRRVIPARALR